MKRLKAGGEMEQEIIDRVITKAKAEIESLRYTCKEQAIENNEYQLICSKDDLDSLICNKCCSSNIGELLDKICNEELLDKICNTCESTKTDCFEECSFCYVNELRYHLVSFIAKERVIAQLRKDEENV